MQVLSEITANVWKVEVADGQQVNEGDTLVILESMKMEIPVVAPAGGICRLAVQEGQSIQEDEVIATIE